MENAQYADPGLVALYDRLNPEGSDTAFYRAQVGPSPKTVLDLGCGTGALAVRLAADGHAVTGLDPAAAMIARAERRDGADRVAWRRGHVGDLPAGARFDAVVMTGHAFQCLLTDVDTADTLAAVAVRLAPNGRFLFESRNPAARAWERWTPDASARRVEDANGSHVRVWHEVEGVADDLVSFRTTYRLPDRDVTNRSILRFPTRAAIERSLRAAGLAAVTCCGDWDGSAWTEASPEIIVIAARENRPAG